MGVTSALLDRGLVSVVGQHQRDVDARVAGDGPQHGHQVLHDGTPPVSQSSRSCPCQRERDERDRPPAAGLDLTGDPPDGGGGMTGDVGGLGMGDGEQPVPGPLHLQRLV